MSQNIRSSQITGTGILEHIVKQIIDSTILSGTSRRLSFIPIQCLEAVEHNPTFILSRKSRLLDLLFLIRPLQYILRESAVQDGLLGQIRLLQRQIFIALLRSLTRPRTRLSRIRLTTHIRIINQIIFVIFGKIHIYTILSRLESGFGITFYTRVSATTSGENAESLTTAYVFVIAITNPDCTEGEVALVVALSGYGAVLVETAVGVGQPI